MDARIAIVTSTFMHYIHFLYVHYICIFNSKDDDNHYNYLIQYLLLFYTFVAALHILPFLIIINQWSTYYYHYYLHFTHRKQRSFGKETPSVSYQLLLHFYWRLPDGPILTCQ